MKITEKIKTFEDACEALDVTPSIPNFDAIPERHQKALLAHYQLVIITEALNEGWKPNWNDDDECKYYPWFDMEGSSSSGFSYNDYDYDNSNSNVSSHLSIEHCKPYLLVKNNTTFKGVGNGIVNTTFFKQRQNEKN